LLPIVCGSISAHNASEISCRRCDCIEKPLSCFLYYIIFLLSTQPNSGESLPHVQSEEFDSLIDKINEMLLYTKNAEIDKQKALVLSLKKQINAHFTVNTLEAIRTLVEQRDFEKADVISSGLIHLVRYAYEKDELINIWDEFEILQKYIVIMNIRYGGKLDVDFDFDDRLMDYTMPRMLLQPVIENSIQHGFKDMESGCFISVNAKPQGDSICFLISDNGCGMSEDEIIKLNEGLKIDDESSRGHESIALLNIKNRLHHYYGDAGRLTIRQSGTGGLEVEITIPFPVMTGGAV